VAEVVECTRDRRCGAQLGLDDDDVPRCGDASTELRDHRAQRLARIRAPRALMSHVPRPAERIPRLFETELADVARDGRLRDNATSARKRIEQLELRADTLSRDDALDE